MTDVDAPPYVSCSVADVLATAEEEKKRKYRAAAEERRASFSPFVVTVDGALGHEVGWFVFAPFGKEAVC